MTDNEPLPYVLPDEPRGDYDADCNLHPMKTPCGRCAQKWEDHSGTACADGGLFRVAPPEPLTPADRYVKSPALPPGATRLTPCGGSCAPGRCTCAAFYRLSPGTVKPIVIVESPFASDSPEGELANLRYARAAVLDSIHRGEVPLASHLLYTQPGILRDGVPAERELGIDLGLALRHVAAKTVVYTDRGISRGMQHGINDAKRCGRPVEFRRLPESEGVTK